MCHRIKIDEYNKMAQIKAWGKVSSHELKDIYIETVGHRDWDAGFNMLCDYNEILNFDVTTDDIYNIIEWQESIDARIGNGRCAVVASRDLVYGMSRIWQVLSSGLSQQVCVFRKMNDALIWLCCTLGLEQKYLQSIVSLPVFSAGEIMPKPCSTNNP